MVKNLRKFRISRGISQQKLADVIGVTQQAINRYERHKIEPDIDTLILLADYFGTTVDDLIGHTPKSPPAGDAPSDYELTREEWALLRSYRQLTKSEKDSILLVMRNYLQR